MSNLNKAYITGNLTRDPELRYTSGGTAVTDLGVAVNDDYTKDGEKVEQAYFFDVTVWGRQAEICADKLRKGQRVLIEGKLKQETWEDQDGNKRSKVKIEATPFGVHFIDPRTFGGGSGDEGETERPARQASSGKPSGGGAKKGDGGRKGKGFGDSKSAPAPWD